MPQINRPLTEEEHRLIRWMLENGLPEAKPFFAQLDLLEVTPERCACWCATLHFHVKGYPPPPRGINVIADFIFGSEDSPNGIFLYEKNGILSGLEVFGYVGNAPQKLPAIEELRIIPVQSQILRVANPEAAVKQPAAKAPIRIHSARYQPFMYVQSIQDPALNCPPMDWTKPYPVISPETAQLSPSFRPSKA